MALRSLGIAGVRIVPMAWIRSVTIAPWRMRSARCCTPYRRPVVAERELVSQRRPTGSSCVRAQAVKINASPSRRLTTCAQAASRRGGEVPADRLATDPAEKVAVGHAPGDRAVGADGGAHHNFNAAATRQERESAAQRVPLVVVPVSRGEVLIREGDTITPAHVALLGALNESSAVSAWLTALGAGLLIVLLVMCVHWFAKRHIQRYRPDARDLAFMVITLVGMMTLCAVGSSIVESVAAQYTSLSLSILRPLVPVSAGALVIGFVLSGASTLVFVVVSCRCSPTPSTERSGRRFPLQSLDSWGRR